MKKISRLTIGSTAIFTKKPAASWLTVNQPYVVEGNGGKTVYLRNPVELLWPGTRHPRPGGWVPLVAAAAPVGFSQFPELACN